MACIPIHLFRVNDKGKREKIVADGVHAENDLWVWYTSTHGPIPTLEPRSNPHNSPGVWHFMISYTQKGEQGSHLASRLYYTLTGAGFKVWFDVQMASAPHAAFALWCSSHSPYRRVLPMTFGFECAQIKTPNR